MSIWKPLTLSVLSLALSACGLGSTNDRLDKMQGSMQTMAGEVQSDRQYLQAGTKSAGDVSDTLTRATNALEKAVSKTDSLDKRADALDSHLAKMADSVDSMSKSMAPLPGAVTELNQSAQKIAKAAEVSEAQIKRVADNMAVMVVYLAVGMKYGMDYMNSHQTPVTPAAAAAGSPPAAPLAIAPAKPTDTVDTSMLDDDDGTKKKDKN